MVRIKHFKEQTAKEKKFVFKNYIKNEIPFGWYIHGRKSKSLNTGRQLQYSKSWNTAIGYATKNGNIFMVKPKVEETLDITNYENSYNIANKFFEDYKDGNLSFENEEIAQIYLMNTDENVENAINTMIEDLNPKDIADTAMFWDSGYPDLYLWIHDTTGKTFFITENGAIDITGGNENVYEKIIRVSVMELEGYFNKYYG